EIIVGLNKFKLDEEVNPDLLKVDEALEQAQIESIQETRTNRDQTAVDHTLAAIRKAAKTQNVNLIPFILDAVKVYATIGEICNVLRDEFGEYAGYVKGERQMGRKIRVLIAKPGLDGHDRGALVISQALRDHGMEVIYTGLRQTPVQIAQAAVQEDVDVIGLSSLSGAHKTLFPKVIEALEERDASDIPVVGGGVIPSEDIAFLIEKGVKKVFTSGSSTEVLAQYIQDLIDPRKTTIEAPKKIAHIGIAVKSIDDVLS